MSDPTAAWPPMPEVRTDAGRSFRIDALEARLRTTAEALRAATTWAAPMRDAPKSARPAWFDDARAVLAQLEKEGLA